MHVPQTPFHAADAKDEGQALVLAPDAITNFADDPEAVQYVQQQILPLVTAVRDDGTAIREEWREIKNMTLMRHDSNQTYKGMSNAYLPLYARALDTRVSHISQALFPTDEYIDVKALGPTFWRPDPSQGGYAQAEVLKAWMQYQFEKQMRLRATIKPFLRQLYDFGVSVGKVWYDKPLQRRQTKTTRLPMIDSLLMDYGNASRACEGTRFQARSMFTWHMWPPTVSSLAEATLVFEDIQMSKQYIEEVGKRQGWKNLDQAIWAPQPGNANADLQLQQDAIRNSPSTAADMASFGDKGHWAYLTEAYFTMPVPKKLYRSNEDPGSHVPVQVLLAGHVPVLIRRNPFWFQHAPYVFQKLNETPDSFYGTGMGRVGKSLQYLANDFMNQTNDNATYGLNPVTIINPNLVVGNLEPLEPGRMWHMTDPSGVRFDRPPIEQMQYGLQMTNQMQSWMNDLLGTPPIMQGSNAKGAARTATGAQILQTNVRSDLQDQVEDIELDVLLPLSEMVHKLGQQYQSQELQVATAGGTINVRPDDLVGEFGFSWLASTQAINQQQRTQQALQLLQIMQPLVPLLQAQGKQFDPLPLIRRVAKEGMGFRDFDACIVDAPAPGMPGMPGQPGPAEGLVDSNTRSAVDQANLGQGEMAPGEGGAFSEVRDNADELAAMMGGMNNG